MTDFVRAILNFLAAQGGEATAEKVGEHFWPDKAALGCNGGGPSRGAVTAAWQLGRIARQRLVERVSGSRPAAYRITVAGHKAL